MASAPAIAGRATGAPPIITTARTRSGRAAASSPLQLSSLCESKCNLNRRRALPHLISGALAPRQFPGQRREMVDAVGARRLGGGLERLARGRRIGVEEELPAQVIAAGGV